MSVKFYNLMGFGSITIGYNLCTSCAKKEKVFEVGDYWDVQVECDLCMLLNN